MKLWKYQMGFNFHMYVTVSTWGIKVNPSIYLTFEHKKAKSRAGLHSIRPLDQMCPLEAFNLAFKAPKFAYFTCFFDKTLFECITNY